MTASANIKTPLMTCLLLEGKTKKDAARAADKIKKITVEHIVENAEASVSYVCSGGKTFHVYKLKMKLCKTEQYPKFADVTVQDWKDVLNGAFRRELEGCHIKLLFKISGITSDSQQQNEASYEDTAGGRFQVEDSDGDADNSDDGADADDPGLDAVKEKLQVNDEIDYDEEQSEGEAAAGSESENEHGIVEDGAASLDDEISENPTQPTNSLMS